MPCTPFRRMKTSSEYYVSPGRGLRRRNRLAEFGAELAAPMTDALMDDHHITFGEDEFKVAKAQAKALI